MSRYISYIVNAPNLLLVMMMDDNNVHALLFLLSFEPACHAFFLTIQFVLLLLPSFDLGVSIFFFVIFSFGIFVLSCVFYLSACRLTIACQIHAFQEPVKDEADIIRFCKESGLPVALDETIDRIQENPLNTLMKYTHPGIVAVVSSDFFLGASTIYA